VQRLAVQKILSDNTSSFSLLMSISRLILGSLLLGSSLTSYAQATEPAIASKFYVGLGVYSGPYQNLGRTNTRDNKYTVPVQATLGYQLRPRLAVQLGLIYSGYKNKSEYDYDYTDTNNYRVNRNSNSAATVRAVNTSLLMRYTLTRQPAHHFQVDLVGGLMLIHQRAHLTSTDFYSYIDYPQAPTSTVENDDSYTYNELNINLGPSFRYRFGQRLEAVGDILFNVPVTGNYRRLDSSVALGLRYRFGPS
jgi:hypothetical protein